MKDIASAMNVVKGGIYMSFERGICDESDPDQLNRLPSYQSNDKQTKMQQRCNECGHKFCADCGGLACCECDFPRRPTNPSDEQQGCATEINALRLGLSPDEAEWCGAVEARASAIVNAENAEEQQ